MSYRNGYVSYGKSRIIVESPDFKSLERIKQVLDRMATCIEDVGYVTLDKYYQMTDGVVTEGDSLYGWKNLLGFSIDVTRYGYMLRVPTPEIINVNPAQEAYNILSDAHEDNYEDCVQDAMDYLRKAL